MIDRTAESVVEVKRPKLILEPSKGWASLQLKGLWEYRELLYFLIWRDVKVRYKQTVLGAAWAVIQPVFTMLVFSLFFGKLGKIPSDGIPYPLFSYSALLPWNFFAQSINEASNSLVGSSNLIRKVYFPRLVIPIAGVLAGLVDFGIAFVVLIGMIIYYKVHFTLNLLLLPLFLLLAIGASLGVGFWLSALNVKYRDVRFTLPFLTQFWLFATPVAYPSSMLSEPWRTLYGLNPMVGVVEGFRWALLNTSPPGPMIGLSAVVTILMVVLGAFHFRRMERTFADLV
ncbi:ABC transporter permease [bacterium]|nr:ABC transporter permease [bacterium]